MCIKKQIGCMISIMFMLAVLGISTANAGIEWQWTNPTPQGNRLNGVVYNGTNQYVAVGDFGTVMTSADSYTWVNGTSGTTNALNDVIWNGTQYLAVGDFGTVLRSTDGLAWTASTAGNVFGTLSSVIWDGTQYVVVGSLGTVMTSVDGVTWTTQTSGTTSTLNDIIWSGTQYVVVGSLGTVLTSADAITWVQQTSPLTSHLNGVAWSGSLFVIVGDSGATLSSADGVTWTSIAWTTFGYHMKNIWWDGTQFISNVGGQYFSSVDGNWGTASYNHENLAMNAIYAAAGSWISVGDGGRIYTSVDGITWTARFSGMKDSVLALANNGNIALALGQQCNFMTSADGLNWDVYTSVMTASSNCADVVWDSTNSQFVASASTYSGGTIGHMYTSPDAVNWTLISTTGPTLSIQSMAHSPSAGFVVVGSSDYVTGEIWSSADAITWTKQTVPNKLNDVAWLNNQFIAVGNNGAILTSPDGMTWTTQASGVAASLYNVAWNGSVYVATGTSNTVLSSADAISWLPQTTGATASTNWSGGLVWTGNQFMLSGQYNGDAMMMSSADGISWVSNNLITNTFLSSVDVFAGKVLAGGNFGVLIAGTNFDVVTTISAGATEVTEGGATDSFDMVLTSAPNSDVTITLSTDPEVTATPAQMVFTPLNWNTPQTTTITAVDDAIAEPTKHIVLTPNVVSLDTRYDALTVPDIAVTVFDNDTPAVKITQTGGSTAVIEGGATDTYDVVLATLPTANVNITIAAAQGQVTTNANVLTFTPANWNIPQTVTVMAIDDAIVEGAHSDSISHTLASADLNYDGLTVSALNITVADNDTGSVLITESGGSTDITEGGATDSFDVVLGMQPSVDVRVGLIPDFNNQCTVSLSPLTFTSANWNVPQTVTVTAVDDGLVEGAHTCVITTSSRSSSLGYNLISVPNIIANVTDNDFLGITLTESGGSTDVAEGGNTDAYDVVLNSQPQLNVTVNIVPNAQVTTSVASVVFTPTNWNTPQTVTVTAVDDGVQEGAHTGLVSHNVTTSDPGYTGFVVADVTVNITDNQAPVIALVGSSPMTITVGGTFTDPGTTVTDDTDVGLVATVTGTVDTNTVASYILTYNVSDAAGNAATPVTRTVNVVAAPTGGTGTGAPQDAYAATPSSGSGGGCLVPMSGASQVMALLSTLMMLMLGCFLVSRRKQPENKVVLRK